MIEPISNAEAAVPAASAGAMLREAREARGMSLDELADQLKVTPRKLECLETDQVDQFPDPVYVRALAQSMCRSLKIDASAVLARLPQTPGQRLDHIHTGLNAPFRDRPSTMLPEDWSGVAKPLIWAPVALLLAAAIVYFFPSDWLVPARVSPRAQPPGPVASAAEITAEGALAPAVHDSASAVGEAKAADIPASAAPAPVIAAAAPAPVIAASAPAPVSVLSPPVATAPTAPPVPSGAAPTVEKAAAAVSGVLQFRTSADSWIEVKDGRGVMLLSRGLQAGEAVGLNGAMPMKVTIGNAAATQVVFRGKAMDMALFTRDNVARFELK